MMVTWRKHLILLEALNIDGRIKKNFPKELTI